jgi:hypothetical protein
MVNYYLQTLQEANTTHDISKQSTTIQALLPTGFSGLKKKKKKGKSKRKSKRHLNMTTNSQKNSLIQMSKTI